MPLSSWFSRFLKSSSPPDDISFWQHLLFNLPTPPLSPVHHSRLIALARRFLATKRYWGAHGFSITPEVAATIALGASLIAYRSGITIYDDFLGIIVYPAPFRVWRRTESEAGIVIERLDELDGETWPAGPVILAWLDDPTERFATILHEFAHRLDAGNGEIDGIPPLPPTLSLPQWQSTLDRSLYRAAVAFATSDPLSSPFTEEAIEDPAEFFAAATEIFFLAPKTLQNYDDALYSHLVELYGLDPSSQLNQKEAS